MLVRSGCLRHPKCGRAHTIVTQGSQNRMRRNKSARPMGKRAQCHFTLRLKREPKNLEPSATMSRLRAVGLSWRRNAPSDDCGASRAARGEPAQHAALGTACNGFCHRLIRHTTRCRRDTARLIAPCPGARSRARRSRAARMPRSHVRPSLRFTAADASPRRGRSVGVVHQIRSMERTMAATTRGVGSPFAARVSSAIASARAASVLSSMNRARAQRGAGLDRPHEAGVGLDRWHEAAVARDDARKRVGVRQPVVRVGHQHQQKPTAPICTRCFMHTLGAQACRSTHDIPTH